MAVFDPNEMITRFRDRATAVRKRPYHQLLVKNVNCSSQTLRLTSVILQSLAMRLLRWKTEF